MKKCAAVLTAVIIILNICCLAFANENQSNMLNHADFIRNSTVEVSSANDGTYELTLSRTTEVESSIDLFNFSNEITYNMECLKIFSLSESETNSILNEINTIKASHTISGSESFLSDSCNIYISLTYTTKTVSNRTFYRVESVTTSVSVNSGTSVSAMKLHLGCAGTDENDQSVYETRHITIYNSPNTNTLMHTFPYIKEGLFLGASFEVTASRPSGLSTTKTVSAPVFGNV